MISLIVDHERKWAIGLAIALIGFDLLVAYHVIGLFRYDELLDHFNPEGVTKSVHPGKLAWLLLINGLSNLLFAVATLIARLMDPYPE